MALILGFFTLWDLPTISKAVASLKHSRLAPVYEEVAPVLGVFGKLFGKALEAQARIAAVNTALTALGMWALAIPGVGLLSLFVFVCSFIPIAGVIISTTPIGAGAGWGGALLFPYRARGWCKRRGRYCSPVAMQAMHSPKPPRTAVRPPQTTRAVLKKALEPLPQTHTNKNPRLCRPD